MARKRNYLNNRDLLDEIIKSKEQDALTSKALEMLMLLANKCNTKLHYANPDDRQDCIASAYMDLFRYWKSFNPEKSSNAFAYFTEVSKRGFAKGWNSLYPKKYGNTVSIHGSVDTDGIYSL